MGDQARGGGPRIAGTYWFNCRREESGNGLGRNVQIRDKEIVDGRSEAQNVKALTCDDHWS